MNRPNVLLVDDEAIVRDSMSEWLRGSHYNVDCAASGKEALDIIQHKKFDVAVVDLKMPGMDGIELMRRVKKNSPWLRVIIITAYSSAENFKEAMKSGANDYLSKPFTPEKLEEAIEGKPLKAEAAEIISPPEPEVAPQPAKVEPVAEKQCIWSKMGAVSYRACISNYKCETCEFAQTLMDKGADSGDRQMMAGMIEKLLEKPGCERLCRYALSGDVSYKLCPNLYQCHHCAFDQQMQERIDAKTEQMVARLRERKAKAR